MRAQIELAACTVEAALAGRLLSPTGKVDLAALDDCTVTVQHAVRVPTGPRSAVYIAWDTHGQCLYVGSVRRHTSSAAVRDRIREHLANDDRRARWYAVTILPLRAEIKLEIVRLCEGWVAHRLRPRDGHAHPAISIDLTVTQVMTV